MPAQKRLYENTDEDLPENNHENHQEQQQQQGEESDRSASSSSGRDRDEFILVRLPDIRKEVQCPICLGIIKKTRTVMECLHRFCRECIDKSMRMGNNECPTCRTHCASRRSLRDDPNYDALIAALFPDIDQYEEEELAFHEEEKARNNQIQALIARTFQRQSEALSKKRRRSQGILRRRRNYRSNDDDDAIANDAGKDSSSADERCIEVFWPPSLVQKPRPPVRMANPEEFRGVIICTRHTDEGFSGPPPEKVTKTPSSSSSLIDYVAAGICAGAGSTTGLEKTYENWPADSGVVLAQPAPQAVPGAELMESLKGPACETVIATRTSAVEPIAGLNSLAAASEATREEPVASAPELAREEPAAAMDETDAFLDRILDEAAASLAREDAPGPSSSGPPPTRPGLESRPARPSRKIYESKRLISAFSREVEQRDRIIADREVEIAWLEARLAASGGELREQTAALEAVMAGVEAENAELKAENAELKAEIIRLKEEDDRLKASNKRLADQAAAVEDELATRMSLHEVGGALHARLLEGLNIGRRIARLVVPDFPVEFINQRNRAAQRKEDLEGEPRDSQGGPPPL